MSTQDFIYGCGRAACVPVHHIPELCNISGATRAAECRRRCFYQIRFRIPIIKQTEPAWKKAIASCRCWLHASDFVWRRRFSFTPRPASIILSKLITGEDMRGHSASAGHPAPPTPGSVHSVCSALNAHLSFAAVSPGCNIRPVSHRLRVTDGRTLLNPTATFSLRLGRASGDSATLHLPPSTISDTL